MDVKVHPGHKFVIPSVFVNIRFCDEPESLAGFNIGCYFEIPDFESVISLQEGGVYDVPERLEDILRPVSVSTARGVVYSELRGTYLQDTIMPVVYMKDFKIEPFLDTSKGHIDN